MQDIEVDIVGRLVGNGLAADWRIMDAHQMQTAHDNARCLPEAGRIWTFLAPLSITSLASYSVSLQAHPPVTTLLVRTSVKLVERP